MKMMTRCPSCATAFRVYPEQLAAREGRVRCGQCATVFDANTTLFSDPEPSRILVETPSRWHAEEIARVETSVSLPVEPSLPPEREISLAEPEDEPAHGFEFGPRGSRRLPHLTALWMVGSVILFLALAIQVVYAYRSDLARLAPRTRPAFEAACHRLGCTIPLPSEAGLISIESSELAAERGATGLFTLTAVLRNRANFTQAHPALELTLTDTQDRPVARRVLLPKDYLDDRVARDAGFAANSEYSLKVHFDAAELPAAGYRLYAFYE